MKYITYIQLNTPCMIAHNIDLFIEYESIIANALPILIPLETAVSFVPILPPKGILFEY